MACAPLEAFLARAKGEADLLLRLQGCPNLEAIAVLGRELGYSFHGVDLVRHQAEATLRLGEEELAAAAAGVELQGHLWLMRIVWG
jgi:predicted ribosomally synthesized peptide with nif11-like leader